MNQIKSLTKIVIKICIFAVLIILYHIDEANADWTFTPPGSAAITCPDCPSEVSTLSNGALVMKPVSGTFSLTLVNSYGDAYWLNLLRNNDYYQIYKGVCAYKGFALSNCSKTGEVTILRIKATAVMPEYFSLISTSVRYGNALFILNDAFSWLNTTTMMGYENWYPHEMGCLITLFIANGGFTN